MHHASFKLQVDVCFLNFVTIIAKHAFFLNYRLCGKNAAWCYWLKIADVDVCFNTDVSNVNTHTNTSTYCAFQELAPSLPRIRRKLRGKSVHSFPEEEEEEGTAVWRGVCFLCIASVDCLQPFRLLSEIQACEMSHIIQSVFACFSHSLSIERVTVQSFPRNSRHSAGRKGCTGPDRGLVSLLQSSVDWTHLPSVSDRCQAAAPETPLRLIGASFSSRGPGSHADGAAF